MISSLCFEWPSNPPVDPKRTRFVSALVTRRPCRSRCGLVPNADVAADDQESPPGGPLGHHTLDGLGEGGARRKEYRGAESDLFDPQVVQNSFELSASVPMRSVVGALTTVSTLGRTTAGLFG